MQTSISNHTLARALAALLLLTACGGRDPADPTELGKATVSGVVKAASGVVIEGASVTIRSVTGTTGADGRFEVEDLALGSAVITTTATDFEPRSQSLTLIAGNNTYDVVLMPADKGVWGTRKGLLVANSEFALAEANGKLYVMGGYPSTRVTSRAVQVYDIATDTWQLGPQLPEPNNHGMAASVNGKIYLIGGQVTDDQQGETAVATVYELDPATGAWVSKTPMPTARSG